MADCAAALLAEDPSNAAQIPVELVTASASGLDPHISPAAAYYYIHRIAEERNISEGELRTLVDSEIEGRQFGILGEPRINVLKINLALDAYVPGTLSASDASVSSEKPAAIGGVRIADIVQYGIFFPVLAALVVIIGRLWLNSTEEKRPSSHRYLIRLRHGF